MDLKPDITVCVLASKRQGLLGNFLKSLHETADPVSFEVIVLDNSQNPALHDLLEKDFPEAMLYDMSNDSSPAKQKNHALRLAKGRYVSFWTDNLRMQNNCLEQLIDFMDNNPETGIGGPQITAADGLREPTARNNPTFLAMLFENTSLGKRFPEGPWLKKYRIEYWNHSHTREVDWITSQGIVIRTEVFEETDVFDEKFSSFYDNADFCRRARQTGWHIHYIAEACAALQTKTTNRKKAGFGDMLRILLKKMAL
jgi:hypothetical protein